MEPLGESLFNYGDYTRWRWIHYGQQVDHVLRHDPATVLDIGPGDHTVADFLARKGIEVDTLDVDPALRPTYLVDIREAFELPRRYDVVLASEVLEHMPFCDSLAAAERLRGLGTVLVISVPYSTIRLFPDRSDYGRILSCEGRVHTGVPIRWWDIVRWPARALVRLRRKQWAAAFDRPGVPVVPLDPGDFSVHHWDAGRLPVRHIRQRLARLGNVSVDIHRDTNSVFFTITP